MKDWFAAAALLGSAGIAPSINADVIWSGAAPPHLLSSQRVGQVDAQDTYHAEQQRREEAIEGEGQRGSGDDATLVGTRPRAFGGPWIAWQGVAAMLSIGFGWLGLLLGRRRWLSGTLFYGGLSALFYIAYAVTH